MASNGKWVVTPDVGKTRRFVTFRGAALHAIRTIEDKTVKTVRVDHEGHWTDFIIYKGEGQKPVKMSGAYSHGECEAIKTIVTSRSSVKSYK